MLVAMQWILKRCGLCCSFLRSLGHSSFALVVSTPSSPCPPPPSSIVVTSSADVSLPLRSESHRPFVSAFVQPLPTFLRCPLVLPLSLHPRHRLQPSSSSISLFIWGIHLVFFDLSLTVEPLVVCYLSLSLIPSFVALFPFSFPP